MLSDLLDLAFPFVAHSFLVPIAIRFWEGNNVNSPLAKGEQCSPIVKPGVLANNSIRILFVHSNI